MNANGNDDSKVNDSASPKIQTEGEESDDQEMHMSGTN